MLPYFDALLLGFVKFTPRNVLNVCSNKLSVLLNWGLFQMRQPTFLVLVLVVPLPKVMYSVNNFVFGEESVICFKTKLRAYP